MAMFGNPPIFVYTRSKHLTKGLKFSSKIPVVRVYLSGELVGNLAASNFCFGTSVVASTHEALEAEYGGVKNKSNNGVTF